MEVGDTHLSPSKSRLNATDLWHQDLSSSAMPLSRVYDLTFLSFWICSTYLTWTVMGPAILRASRIRLQKDRYIPNTRVN